MQEHSGHPEQYGMQCILPAGGTLDSRIHYSFSEKSTQVWIPIKTLSYKGRLPAKEYF